MGDKGTLVHSLHASPTTSRLERNENKGDVDVGVEQLLPFQSMRWLWALVESWVEVGKGSG
eukprot:scaffold25165_cov72-Cyclotella_meneghiniana.AAC.3